MTDQGQGWGQGPQGPAGSPGPAPPPPSYQYGPGGYAPPQTDGMAIAALVVAICSFVVFPIIPAIIALVLASSSNKKIAESGGRLTGQSLNKVATILSWINIGLAVVGAVLAIILIAAFAGSS